MSAAPAELSAGVLMRLGLLRERPVVTYLNVMQLTAEDALSGLVMPAAADVILGKAGSVLVIAIAFMAVTSSGASEMVGAAQSWAQAGPILAPALCSGCCLTEPWLTPLHAQLAAA